MHKLSQFYVLDQDPTLFYLPFMCHNICSFLLGLIKGLFFEQTFNFYSTSKILKLSFHKVLFQDICKEKDQLFDEKEVFLSLGFNNQAHV